MDDIVSKISVFLFGSARNDERIKNNQNFVGGQKEDNNAETTAKITKDTKTPSPPPKDAKDINIPAKDMKVTNLLMKDLKPEKSPTNDAKTTKPTINDPKTAKPVTDDAKTNQQQEEASSRTESFFGLRPETSPIAIEKSPIPIPNFVFEENVPPINYHAELISFMHNNLPSDFHQKLTSVMPYVYTSCIAWPVYWLYRGYQWRTVRNTERIGRYIHRTFQHAKLIQIAIIASGIVAASSGVGPQLKNVSNDHKSKKPKKGEKGIQKKPKDSGIAEVDENFFILT